MAYTPPYKQRFLDMGYDQANTAPKHLQYDILSYLAPALKSGAQFSNELEQGRQSAVGNALAVNSPGNVQAQTQRDVIGMLNRGQASGQNTAEELQARGYGPEYAMAAKASVQGQAQRGANQHQAEEGERINRAYMNAMQIIVQGQQHPLWNQAMQLIQSLEAERSRNKDRRAAKDAAGGGMFGGLLGTALGGFDLTKLFGGGANPAIQAAVNAAQQGLG